MTTKGPLWTDCNGVPAQRHEPGIGESVAITVALGEIVSMAGCVRLHDGHLSFPTRNAPTSLRAREKTRSFGRTAAVHGVHAQDLGHGFGHGCDGGGDEHEVCGVGDRLEWAGRAARGDPLACVQLVRLARGARVSGGRGG